MDHEKLRGLNDDLAQEFQDYISMIAVGSIVTGDPYIEGRSDKDILLMFNNDPTRNIENIGKLITKTSFDDSYVFVALPQKAFGLANSKYAFSNRFRSKTLFGEDLIPLSKLPNEEVIQKTYEKGLESVTHQLNNNLINSGIWSTEKIRDSFWKQFKHAFMYLAIKSYHQTGEYPQARKDVADKLQSPEVNDVWNTLHSIDQQPKETIIDSAKGLVSYLSS